MRSTKAILISLFGFWLVCQADAGESITWLNVLDSPLAKAGAENKLILVEFTGSDWSEPAKKFDNEALSTPEFNDYAGENLILVKVDFPRQAAQGNALKEANSAWQKRFQVTDFPVFILINSNCRALGRQDGYAPGGPKSFIEKIERWKGNNSASTSGDGQWLTDLPKAQALAKADNKLVLLDFTGSDWCVWCKRLEADTLSKQEFIDYAKKNLVLVQLDYPDQKPQPSALKSANAALQAKYKIDGFPTLIAMKADGTIVWRISGYLKGGPEALIGQLEKAKK